MHRPHVNAPAKKKKSSKTADAETVIKNALHAMPQSKSEAHTPNGDPPVLRLQPLLHHAQVIEST